MRIGILAIVCLAASPASAEPDKERAAKLFEEGRDLAKRASFREACDRFAQSYELDPALGTQINFADCQEHLGRLSRAWQLFDEAARRSDDAENAVRAQYARDRANTLLPRLATLVLRIADARLDQITVTIGGRQVKSTAELHAPVDPGDVEVVVVSPAGRFAKTVHTTAGRKVMIEVPIADGIVASPQRSRPWMIGAITATGTGLGAMTIAGVLGVYAARHYNKAFARGDCFTTHRGPECTPAGLAIVDDAHSRANLATGVFVGGVVLVGGGIALYLLAPRTRGVEVAPTATTTSVGAVIQARF